MDKVWWKTLNQSPTTYTFCSSNTEAKKRLMWGEITREISEEKCQHLTNDNGLLD